MFHQCTGPNTTPRHPPPPCWASWIPSLLWHQHSRSQDKNGSRKQTRDTFSVTYKFSTIFLPERIRWIRKYLGNFNGHNVVSCLTALYESLIVAKVIISTRSAWLLHGFDPKMASHGMSPRHRDSCVKEHGNRHFNALKDTWMHWSQHVESPVLANR